MRTSIVYASTLVLATLLPLHAQDRNVTGSGPYKVEFTIHDGTDAAAKAGRHYTLLLDDSYKGTFHVSSRVPVPTGPGVATQFSYMDTGVNIDCTVHDLGGKMALHGSLDINGFTRQDAGSGAVNVPNPTVRQTRLDLEAILDPAKPTVVASIEDPESSRSLRVEVTITKGN